MERVAAAIDTLCITPTGAHQTGPLVVLLHGGPGFYGYLSTLREWLGQFCFAITYAQRGTIANPCDSSQLSLEAHFSDLDAIVNHFGEDRRLILVGHSWGASLALLYAGSRRESVDKVVAVATAPLSVELDKAMGNRIYERLSPRSRFRADALRKAIVDATDENVMNANFSALQKVLLETYSASDAVFDQIPDIPMDFLGFCGSKDQFWAAIESGTATRLLDEITADVVAIHGEDDVIDSVSTIQFLGTHLKTRLSTYSLPHCGHFPWFEPGARLAFFQCLKRAVARD